MGDHQARVTPGSEIVITQQMIGEGCEFYCLCHGWCRPETAVQVCSEVYAIASGPPPATLTA